MYCYQNSKYSLVKMRIIVYIYYNIKPLLVKYLFYCAKKSKNIQAVTQLQYNIYRQPTQSVFHMKEK